MASLGNIWFDLNLKDHTKEDLDKIVKKLSKENIEIDVTVDKDKLSEALSEAAKESSKSNKNFTELAETLGVSAEQAKALVDNIKKASAGEISLLNNTERMTRAKERLLELERSVLLRRIDQTEQGKKILEWTKQAKATLESVDITDKTAVIKAAGADLSAQINIRKDLMRHTTKSINEQIKGNRSIENSNLSIEKALIRIGKIRDRIKNDPFREQEGYVGVNKEIDKLKTKLESMKGQTRDKTKGYLAIDFNKEVQGIENLIKKQDQLFRVTEKQTSMMGRLWGQMGNQVKSVLSIYALQRFTRQLIEMGGEFEKQHFALRAIIGDIGKADQIFNNLKKVAVKSPFHFGDFTGFAKQLAAFSIPVNEIYDTTKRLADVSAGLGVDMGRIILAYGQIRSASFLRGQEVRQLTEAGIPIIEELSEKLTELRGQVVSTSEVFDAISRREVPFAMVKEVFKELTDEGGKFYNMQEVLAESLSGKWANLTSHYQIMLYDMAQSNRGYLNKLIEVLTALVKNFRMVESAIVGMLAAYTMGKVAKMAGDFNGLSEALKNVGSGFKDTIKKVFSGGNMLMAGAFAVGTAITYVVSKTNEYRDKIADMIEASSRIEENVNKHFKALITLANQEKENIDVSVKRHNVLLELAKTEPELANELRKHADDLGYLTKRTEEYTSALQTARSVSLMLEKGDDKLSILFDSSAEEYADEIAKNEALVAKKVAKSASNVYALMEKYGKRFHSAIRKSYGEELGNVFIDILDDTTKTIEEKVIAMAKVLDENLKEGFFRNNGILLDALGDAMSKTTYGTFALEQYISRDTKLLEKKTKTAADMIKNELLRLDVKQYEKDTDGVDRVTKEWTDAVMLRLNMLKDTSDAVKISVSSFLGVDFKNSMETSVDDLDGWRKEISDILEGVIHISDQTSLDSVINDISTEINNAKKYLDGIDIKKLNALVGDGTATDAQKELVKNYKLQTDNLEKLTQASILLGIVEKKNNPTNKDPFAEKMSERVRLIEDANKAYEKYIPLLGKVGALEKVRGDSRFKQLNFDPSKFSEYLKDVYGKLGNTDAQKKLKEQLEKTFSDIDFNNVKEGVDKFAKDLSKYITDNKERWSIYDKLFDQTGNHRISFTLAFGTETEAEAVSYIESLKNKIKLETGTDNEGLEALLGLDPSELESEYGKPIIDLINTTKDAIKKSREEILLSDAKAIAEVATLEEKANSIRGKYAKRIDEASSEKARLAHLELMDKELSNLYSKAIELNPIWRELFGDVSDYSYRMLNDLVKKAKELLDTAEEVKDKDGRGTGMFKLTDKNSKEEYTITGEAYTRLLKNVGKKSEEIRQRNPFSAFAKSWKDFIDADKGDDKEKALTKLMLTAGMAADEVSNMASSFSDMFDSLGNEELADTVGLIGEISGSLGGIASGFAQGGVVGGVTASLSAIPNIIGSIAKRHDKKLDRKIQKSANEVRRLQNAYEDVNREIERQLGRMSKSQVDKQVASLKGQVSQTYQMMENERKKKKSDVGKIEDYKQQIKELNDQIAFFYEDLAKTLYEIDIKGWANQFGDSIMEAWKKGEDGAMAFQKTANDILSNVANKMVTEMVLEPVFKKLRKELPKIMSDGKVSPDEIKYIAQILVDLGSEYGDAMDKLDEIDKAVIEASGGTLSLKGSEGLASNLGKGIQENITEDTAQLLGSYLNAIRQDVSVKRELLTKIAEAFDGSIIGNIATMAADIKKIEANTFRSANGVDSINDKLDSVMNGTKQIYTN